MTDIVQESDENPLGEQVDPADNAETTKPVKSRRQVWRRWLKVTAFVTSLLAAFVGGAAASQWLWPREQVTYEVVKGTDIAPGAIPPQSFPHLIGLVESDARAAIGAAGYVGAVTVETQPAAGPEGAVVTQTPQPGESTDSDGPITLVLSSVATMPDVVGQDRLAAAAQVEQFSGIVQYEIVVDGAHPAGQVIETVPAAGEPMPLQITLKVADGGVPLLLSDVSDIVRDGCSDVADVSLNGTQHVSGIGCYVSDSYTKPRSIEYGLGRHANFLQFTLGIDDRTEDTAGGGAVTIIGDGAVLATATVAFGATQDFNVDVTGVLRLRIEVVSTTPEHSTDVTFGTAALIGSPDEIALIQK